MLGFYLFLGLYSSDVFAGEQSNPGPGLAIMCFRDSQCKIEPPSHLLTSAFNGEIKDCYPGSDPDNPALSCLTASLDYDWQDCAG